MHLDYTRQKLLPSKSVEIVAVSDNIHLNTKLSIRSACTLLPAFFITEAHSTKWEHFIVNSLISMRIQDCSKNFLSSPTRESIRTFVSLQSGSCLQACTEKRIQPEGLAGSTPPLPIFPNASSNLSMKSTELQEFLRGWVRGKPRMFC